MTSIKIQTLFALFVTCFISISASAQGDGARVYLHAPIDINALSLTYMDISGSQNFAGDIQIPNADIQSNVWALNYNRFFSVGGRLAEIWATGIFGSVDGGVQLPQPLSTLEADGSGLADPYLSMRIGLIGAPALTPTEFAGHKPGFQLYALAGFTAPLGEYDSSKVLNLGTNRWSYRLATPMVFPFGGATSLELTPSIYLYGDNDDPYGATNRTQDSLFVAEAHLTHNFTPKFWAGIDLRYQNGGETNTDGVADNNKNDQLGGGVVAGYAFTRSFSTWVSYDEIIKKNDKSKGDMLRVRFVFVY